MSGLPSVLGLPPDEASARLAGAGFQRVRTLESGRRKEGRPRVIRQKVAGDEIELIVSYFKELNTDTEDVE